jgi:hypothetical protein
MTFFTKFASAVAGAIEQLVAIAIDTRILSLADISFAYAASPLW